MTSATEHDWRSLWQAYFGEVPQDVADVMAAEIRNMNPTRAEVNDAIRQLAQDYEAGKLKAKPKTGSVLATIRRTRAERKRVERNAQAARCSCNGLGWVTVAAYCLAPFAEYYASFTDPTDTVCVLCPDCPKGEDCRRIEVEAGKEPRTHAELRSIISDDRRRGFYAHKMDLTREHSQHSAEELAEAFSHITHKES